MTLPVEKQEKAEPHHSFQVDNAGRETSEAQAEASENGDLGVHKSNGQLNEVVVSPEADGRSTVAAKSSKSRIVTALKFVKRKALEYWFILFVLLAIGIAAAWPNLGKNGGYLATQYSVKYGAVMIIFFLTGLSLKTRVLAQAFINWRLHLVVQLTSLGVIPAIGYGIYKGLSQSSFNPYLAQGIVIATSMPTTVSTNVVFTQQAGGNEPAAVVNAIVGMYVI